MHFQGDGVVQDLGIAAKYFKIGAELGNASQGSASTTLYSVDLASVLRQLQAGAELG